MKLIQQNGNIILYDWEKNPIKVANVKYGIVYAANDNKLISVPRLTVYHGLEGLEDMFLFYKEGKPPVTHIQSREINPALEKIYLKQLSSEAKYTLTDFIHELIVKYFIDCLGFELPEFIEIPESLFED